MRKASANFCFGNAPFCGLAEFAVRQISSGNYTGIVVQINTILERLHYGCVHFSSWKSTYSFAKIVPSAVAQRILYTTLA